jgi:hypothetical protein
MRIVFWCDRRVSRFRVGLHRCIERRPVSVLHRLDLRRPLLRLRICRKRVIRYRDHRNRVMADPVIHSGLKRDEAHSAKAEPAATAQRGRLSVLQIGIVLRVADLNR